MSRVLSGPAFSASYRRLRPTHAADEARCESTVRAMERRDTGAGATPPAAVSLCCHVLGQDLLEPDRSSLALLLCHFVDSSAVPNAVAQLGELTKTLSQKLLVSEPNLEECP